MPLKNSQQKIEAMRNTKTTLEPYTLMRGPDFLGGLLALVITWLLRDTLEPRTLVIVAIAIYIVSSYVFLYFKKRLGFVQMSWKNMALLQIKGYLIALPIFVALYYLGYFK